MELAEKLLGYRYRTEGVVEHGQKLGRTLGFPTLNVAWKPEKAAPRFGVYACRVKMDGTWYCGIGNLGIKPTVTDAKRILTEVYVFDYNSPNKGIELITIDNSYQLCTKTKLHEYIYPIIDKRTKPNLSNAALETLSIIAYNPRITRAEIENIRGVNVDGCIYKLLEYGLIEEAGKLDLPGKPMSYKTSKDFLRMFGYSSLEELPQLPKFKLDENRQIVID